MRIHTDHNGLAVNAIARLADGTDVAGHHYQVLIGDQTATIDFQRGPVKDNGVNGLTNEALLAILINRTRHLDDKFPCKENKEALFHMESALAWLNQRTAARLQQGVEGTNVAHEQPAAEQISGQPTHVAILRTALGAMVGGETEAELAELDKGIDQMVGFAPADDVAIMRQAVAAMRQTAPGTIEPVANIAVGLKLDASVAIGQVQDAQTGLQLLAKVRAFIEKHSLGCPESLYQRDNPQIDALTVMGDLCELAGWQQDEEGGE